MTLEDICRISTVSGGVGKTAVDMTSLAPRHEIRRRESGKGGTSATFRSRSFLSLYCCSSLQNSIIVNNLDCGLDFEVYSYGSVNLNMPHSDVSRHLSSMLTRSKAAARQQATATEEDLVTINWILFDKSDPEKCIPYPIEVPRSLFNGTSKKCQRLFASEILNSLSLSVPQNTVKFWKVSGIHHSWCQTH
jgi:hypothetical protein